MRLSVVVPAYNEQDYLPACLESILAELARNTARGEFEIIVVDNTSTDRTAEVASRFPGVRVVTEPRKGLTRARQCSLDQARGTILAYVDADTRMPPGWVGRSSTRSTTTAWFLRQRPCLLRCVSDQVGAGATLLAASRPTRLRPDPLHGRRQHFRRRADALARIDGFDMTIPFYGEDTDIARDRARRAGRLRHEARHADLRPPAESEGILRTAIQYATISRPSRSCASRCMRYRDIR